MKIIDEFWLWCAEQIIHLGEDNRVDDCLAVVLRRVESPNSVSDDELAAAMAAAMAAAWDVVMAAVRAAQRQKLSGLLLAVNDIED